jgi:hypothetical protein
MTNKNLKKILHDRWRRSWSEYQTKNKRRNCVALSFQIFTKRLKLHNNLFKIESSLITQMRTNRIELRKYLFHRRIFIIVISACFCDWFKQTIKHVMLFYFNHNRTRKSMLLVVETQNLRRLLNINKKIKVMTRWLMKTDILAQFSLTIECLEWFSLSYVNKTNAHRINMKISIFRIQDDYASSWRRKNKKKFLFFRRFFFHTYSI